MCSLLLEGYYFLAFSMDSTRKHKFVYPHTSVSISISIHLCILLKTEFILIPSISVYHYRVLSINTFFFAL